MSTRRIIIFIVIFFAAAAGWSTYWVLSARIIESTLKDAIADETLPIKLRTENMRFGGYPFHHKISFPELHIEHHSGAFIRMHEVTAIALAYKPKHWIAETTHPFEFGSPENSASGESKLMQVSLLLPTPPEKKNIEVGFSAQDLVLMEDQLKFAVDDLKASFIIRNIEEMDYTLAIEAQGTRFDESDETDKSLQMAYAALSSESLPGSKHFKWDLSTIKSPDLDFEIDAVRGDVFYTQTINVKDPFPNFQNMEAWFATLREIQLNAFHIALYDIVFKADGTVAFLPNGIPEGRIDIELKNWRSALSRLSGFEEIPTTNQQELESFFNLMTFFSEDPNLFEIGLDFRNGKMFLGDTAIMQF